ncbi:MAG: septum formation initiator family protein [Actinomycetota bacterium]|nr:septum formation initiator family protein [Actinomycetota bacterium]
MAAQHLSRIQWDRVARWALLAVLFLIVYAYIGPARSLLAAYREADAKQAQVAALKARNAQLAKREQALQTAATLEREARLLGMVRAGERAYIVKGLPADKR